MNKETIYREDAIDEMERIMADHPLQGYEDELLLINAIKSLPSADRPQGWIPCSERLPTLNEDGVSDMVLLCWSDGQMAVGAYQGNRTFCGQAWPEAKDCRVTVVAWMPLPPAWKGAEDDTR